MSENKFKNQTVIITGATRGIGKDISKSFLEQGATVIGTYFKNNEAAKILSSETQNADHLHLYKFNVSDYSSCEDFYKEIEQQHPKIDILINNSGIRKDKVLAMMSEDDWDAVIQTNLSGSYHMSKFAIHHMMKHRYGRIINISSPMSRLGFAGQSNYAASKAGLEGMTKSLSKEVASRGITVNCVSPGFIETELIQDLDDNTIQTYKKLVPMKKFGSPADVSHAVLFLAQEESKYITGITLEVAGGI